MAWRATKVKPRDEARTARQAKTPEPTRAELATRAKEDGVRLQEELSQLVSRWRVRACAAALATDHFGSQFTEPLLMWFLANTEFGGDAEEYLAKACGAARLDMRARWQKICRQLMHGEIVASRLLAHVMLAREKAALVEDFEAAPIAERLGVDPGEEWGEMNAKGGQAMMGTLTEEYLAAHSDAQLRGLFDEWELQFAADAPREAMVDAVLHGDHERLLPLPAELRELLDTKSAKRPRKAK